VTAQRLGRTISTSAKRCDFAAPLWRRLILFLVLTSQPLEPPLRAEFGQLCCGVPPVPTGGVVLVNILSTHGDPHYVGLNGLQAIGPDGTVLAPRLTLTWP
jgi:hypothetical protein